MSEAPDPDTLRRLRAAVANLPRRQREIFLAHRLDDLSYLDIAGSMGLSVRRVERQIARAIYKIAKQMDGQRLSWWERLF